VATDDCPFCRQLSSVEQLPPSELVWQFPQSIALLGPWQYYQGYSILVSRRHASELFHLPSDERRAYLDEMCLLAQAIADRFRPQKLNYELLGNQVPHLHWHLFPRYPDDPQALWPVWVALERAERDEEERCRLQAGPLDRAAIADGLRRSLRDIVPP
jgi:diadenosine tetraphosphate (Ap4A) HIT family hydrolase